MLTRKEAEAKIAELLAQIKDVVTNSEPWNGLPPDDQILCAGINNASAWAFVLGPHDVGEVIAVDVRGD